MKNAINYFYGFSIENLRMINDDYYFNYKNKNFTFQQLKEEYYDYNMMLRLNNLMLNNNSSFYQIILNRNNEIATKINNKQYILLQENFNTDRIFDLFDIINTNIPVNTRDKNKIEWIKLWEKKIDYFEMYLEHNKGKYLNLNKFANYFIGMGESAILYAKNTLNDTTPKIYDRSVISHKRINTDRSYKDLYNPLLLMIDHPSRDVSEYFKEIYFKNSLQVSKIKEYLEQVSFSDYGARLLMARMLFPSFFFDNFEKLVDSKISNSEITRIVDKMSGYEKYLFKILNILKQKYNIPEIEWLKKADYSSTLITPSTSGTSFTSIDSIPSFNVTSIMLQ